MLKNLGENIESCEPSPAPPQRMATGLNISPPLILAEIAHSEKTGLQPMQAVRFKIEGSNINDLR